MLTALCPSSFLDVSTLNSLQLAPNSESSPTICSGSWSDIGPRSRNEDSHLQIDDLSASIEFHHKLPQPCSFYALFDGHGGSEASSYLKENALRLFLDGFSFQEGFDVYDDSFTEELKKSHCEAFLQADEALANEGSVDEACGSTALTALVLGRLLMIANAGDCRAVLSRKGAAIQLSQDHRPDCMIEQKRVQESGGFIEDGYLNGELGVTRSLGDWFLKSPAGLGSPLIAEPDVHQFILTEDDEFLIMGCDGLWDVMSNQEAVKIVQRELRQHGDPQRCAKELVRQALRRDTADNITVIVVCLTPCDRKERDSAFPQRPRFKFNLSAEAREKLKCFLESN